MPVVRVGLRVLTAALLGGVAGGAFAAPDGASGGTCAEEALATGECEAANLISQEDFDRVHAILEQKDAASGSVQERIRAEREKAGSLAESARGGLEEFSTEDLPGRVAEFVDQGDLEEEGLPFSTVAEDGKAGVTHTLLLSESIPASQRRTLLKEAAKGQEEHPDSEVAVYFQGPLVDKDIDETMRQFSRWLKEADLEYSAVAVGINNKVFDRHGVEAVPTWVSERNGELVAKASGLGDLDYVLEQAEEADEPDIGRRGNVWSVAEPHFVEEYVKTRIQDWIQAQGGKEAILDRARSSYWDHQAITSFDLGVVEQEASYLVDLEITATEDIRNPETGRVVIRAGTTARPSEVVRWTRHMAFFDPTRPEEVRWVRRWLARKRAAGVAESNLRLFITSIQPNGSWEHYGRLSEALGKRPYLLDRALKRRLGIRATPSTVTPARNGTRLRVTEHPARETSLASFARLAGSRLRWGLERGLHTLVGPARAAGAEKTPEQAAEAACNDADFFGSLISDVCWDCHTPWSFAGEDLGDDAPPGYYDKPACMCEPPDPGISTGAWLPARLVEFVRIPYCSPIFGGTNLDFGVGAEDMYAGGRKESGVDPAEGWFRHYHYWSFPAGEVLGMTLGCEIGPDSIDVMYYSEMDGAWNDDQVALMTHPEAALFATTVAQIPCAMESVRLARGEPPVNELFWCAGSWGSLYPFAGWITHNKSPARDVALLGARVLAALGRRGLLHDLVGDPCAFRAMPQLIKTNFRWQHIFPVPDANNTHWTGEEPIGGWGEHRSQATNGEDYVRLLWRWTDCCLDI